MLALNLCPGGGEDPCHPHLSPQLQPLLFPTQSVCGNPGFLSMPPLRVRLSGQGSSYSLRLLLQKSPFHQAGPRFAHPGGDISAHPHKARLCLSIDSFESPASSEPFSWMQISLSPSGGGQEAGCINTDPTGCINLSSPHNLHNGVGGRLS